MALFDFMKSAGQKIVTPSNEDAVGVAALLQQAIAQQDLGVEGLEAKVEGDKVVLSGHAGTAEAVEKAILLAGNVQGIAQVESLLQSSETGGAATFYTVQSGDTLSKIAKAHYGSSGRYQEIFEANRPMLDSPDNIYPGQALRIPQGAETAIA